MVQAPAMRPLRQPARQRDAEVKGRQRQKSYNAGHTFCICPVGIEIGQSSLVADLLERLWGLVVDLKDAAGSPPASAVIAVVHVEVDATTARRFGAHVVGGSLEEDWGRQFGGSNG